MPLVYKIANGNNTGTTSSAIATHASNKGLSHRSAVLVTVRVTLAIKTDDYLSDC